MFQVDTVYKNGTIYTMNPKQPRAQALAITGNLVVGVGNNDDMESVIGPDTKVYDIGGKTMIPGFNDSHNHMIVLGFKLTGVPVTPEQCPDIEAIKQAVAKRVSNLKPGEWVRGFGFDESRMMDGRMINAYDLDEVAPNNPVQLSRTCGHMSIVNNLAIKLAKIDNNTPDPNGGKIIRDEHGKATGLLQDAAQHLVLDIMPPFTKKEIVSALDHSCKAYNACGITSSTDSGVIPAIAEEVEGWAEASNESIFTVRTSNYMYLNSADKPTGFNRLIEAGLLNASYGNAVHRFAGAKFLLDGSVGGATAATYEPYLTPPKQTGVLYMEQEELDSHVRRLHDAGVQLSIHAIGERALDQALLACKKAINANPRMNHRHRIEHASLATKDHLQCIKDLNIYVGMQPGFFYFLGDSHLKNIGSKRVEKEFPIRSAMDLGIITALGTDCPVIDINPKYTLYSTVFRKTISGQSCGTAEGISMETAIWAYTQAGAYLTFEENIKGSLAVGKLADFTILSMDPMKVDMEHAQDILNMSVIATVMDGKLVYGGF